MKKVVFALSLFVLFTCHDNHRSGHASQVKESEHEHHDDSKTGHGQANEFMHRSSVEHLIDRFESPERDAYQQPEKVMDYLGDIKDKTVIDIGAGSGYFSVRLAERGANVIAADVDDEFQAFIKSRIEKENLNNIETRKIPYDAPGLKDQEVDLVLLVNTYHHIEDRPAYFSKVKKGTKTDGELVIIDYFKYDIPVGPPTNHKISIDLVIGELKEAGYTNFTVNVDLLDYQYIINAY